MNTVIDFHSLNLKSCYRPLQLKEQMPVGWSPG